MRVWIDTDVGDNPDDAVALLLALAHPRCELVGVSTVSGDVEGRVGVARRLLGDACPVRPGGRERGSELAGELTEAEPDVVVAIGPLGSVAGLLDAGFRSPIVAMAGALGPTRHRGAVRDVETNAGADPSATARVVRSGRAVLVPLDVTRGMLVGPTGRAGLASRHAELARQLSAWSHELVLHDPLALLVALGDAPATVEPRSLDVDADGRLLDGTHRCEVVTGADVDAATERVLALVADRR